MPGVYRTLSGYAGGAEPDPNYLQMKDYTETVLVEFNPEEISYRQLLDVFWDSHDPSYETAARQYRNAVFYRSDAQRLAAEKSAEEIRELIKRPVHTAIERAGDFYPAEDYHQKYYLRRTEPLFKEFRKLFPDEAAFASSTAATRINGYLGCNGRKDDLQRELGQLGLSHQAQNYLIDYLINACQRFDGLTCPAPPRS